MGIQEKIQQLNEYKLIVLKELEKIFFSMPVTIPLKAGEIFVIDESQNCEIFYATIAKLENSKVLILDKENCILKKYSFDIIYTEELIQVYEAINWELL